MQNFYMFWVNNIKINVIHLHFFVKLLQTFTVYNSFDMSMIIGPGVYHVSHSNDKQLYFI